MGQNRGKQFEQVIKDAFLKVPNVSVDRLPDQVSGFKVTSANPCDFIIYKKPHEYYIECKTTHGNTLPLSNIRQNQWDGLLEKSRIDGVIAGVICWWVDKDVTFFLPIQLLEWAHKSSFKSVPYNFYDVWMWREAKLVQNPIEIDGKKKRVFFDYDMDLFFHKLDKEFRKYE